MTRLVHELGELKSGVRGHITSTLPIRSENGADEWEKMGLLRMQKDGIDEVAELQPMDGGEYLRYIAPLTTEQSCLTCHAFQGYKVGDQRGGISVSVPMAPIRAGARAAVTTLALSHAGMWLLGVLTLTLGGARLSRQMREQEELRASKEAAESADKAKSEFLANMSHEIRTPLNGVVGMADLLLRSGLDEDKTSMAVTIKAAGENLLSVVNDILDFSKIEAGKVVIDPRPFCPRDMVFDAVNSLSPEACEKKLAINVRIEPQTPDKLIGDDHRIRQVLLNLTGNAVKFTEQGDITLSVRVLARTASAVTLRFAVTDTGIGIAPDKQRHIFSAFEQADSSTTRKYGGTGLGLSISHRLVKLMGGVLRLEESRPGHGSTFSFDLDLLPADGAVAPEPPVAGAALQDPSPGIPTRIDQEPLQTQAREDAERRPVSGLSILLAEDMPMNRFVASRMLNNLGHTVTIAGNGQEALDILAEKRFDIVFMDIQMPVMDGTRAVAEIRAAEAARGGGGRLPVVAMTAHALKGDKEKYLNAGMDAYLSKPVLQSELAAVIEDIARRFAVTASAKAEPAGRTADSPVAEAKPAGPEEDHSPPAALDPELIEQIFAGDTGLAAQSMLLYLRDAPGLLAEIDKAVAGGDSAGLAARAHALKGLTGHYTRGVVFTLCLRAERMGREERLPAAKDEAKRCAALLGAKAAELMRAMEAYRTAHECSNPHPASAAGRLRPGGGEPGEFASP
jgi:signal transduction histidine kinase/CheY-like chemotaxis protein